jgi:hypothetical protein
MSNREGYFKEYYQKNKEKIKERVRLYEINNREETNVRSKKWANENKEKRKLSNQKWRAKRLEENPNYFREVQYEYRHRDMEKHNKLQREWRKDNPILVRRQKYKRRCLETREDYGIQEILGKLQQQGGRCVYCSAIISERYVIEHKTPLSRGGRDSIGNIDLTCRGCNTSKSRMTKEEYLDYLQHRNGTQSF